jgi:hypothetical protein
MRKDFVINFDERFGRDNIVQTAVLVRMIMKQVGDHWLKMIPETTQFTAVGARLCSVRDCSLGIWAQLGTKINFETMQVCLVDEIIWCHQDQMVDFKSGLFTFELLTAVGYALCQNPVFVKYLRQHMNGSTDPQRVFVANFPIFLFPKGREKLSEKMPKTLECLESLDKVVSDFARCLL